MTALRSARLVAILGVSVLGGACQDDAVAIIDACGGCESHASCRVQANRPAECVCDAGFSGDPGSCRDVDECATNHGGCDAHALCVNTIGSRTCRCSAGYAGDGRTCQPSSEGCDASANGCDVNALCGYEAGEPRCRCQSGWTGDGLTCSDVDECKGTTDCSPNAVCWNDPGAFHCTCNTGYTGDGRTCVAVNECLTDNGGCDVHARCSFESDRVACACLPDFVGDGFSCRPIQERLLMHGTFKADYRASAVCPGWHGIDQWTFTNWAVPRDASADRYGNIRDDGHLRLAVDLTLVDLPNRLMTGGVRATYTFEDSCLGTVVFDLNTDATALADAHANPVTLTVLGKPRSWSFDENQALDAAGATITLTGAITIDFDTTP